MERSHHVAALLHPHRVAVILRQDRAPGAETADDGCTDKDRLQVVAHRHGNAADAAVGLPAVSVALDGEIHQAQARLRGMCYFAGQQDRSGATAEDRLVLIEALERFGQPFLVQQLQHGGTFATRDDQAVAAVQVGNRAYLNGVSAGPLYGLAMRFKVALQRQNAGSFHATLNGRYQPRVCISSLSGSLEMSRPRMASPSSSLASSSLTGSL